MLELTGVNIATEVDTVRRAVVSQKAALHE